MRILIDILGIVFLLIIIQAVRAYFATKPNECKELGIDYFPLNTVKICKGQNTSTNSTNSNTGT